MSSPGFRTTQQKVQALISAMRDLATLIGEPGQAPLALKTGFNVKPGLGLTGDAASLTIRAKDMEQGIFKVLVLGEFKNGKSTLLNAMLGHKTLPARAAPTTAIITELVYGSREEVAVYESGNDGPRLLSWDNFIREFQLSERDVQALKQQQYLDRFQHVEYAQLECLHPFCANGVRLIDSPGLGEHISRTRVTTNFLKQSQAVIFVLNALSILTEAERAYIERLGTGQMQNVFFVVNRVNQIDQSEVANIQDWVRRSLQHHFLDEQGQFDEALYQRRVFFLNARGALDARMTVPNNETLLEASGILPLEAELERFLTTDEKLASSLAGTIHMLATVVAGARRKIAQQQRSLGEPLQELERRRIEAEQRLAALEVAKNDIQRTIHFFGETIKQKIYTSLLDFINRMHETWPEDSVKHMNLTEAMNAMNLLKSFVSNEAKEQVIASIKNEIRIYLQVKLTEWSEHIPAIVRPDAQKLADEAKAQINDFQRELEAVESIFASGATDSSVYRAKSGPELLRVLGETDLSHMTGALLEQSDWQEFIGQAVQQAVTVNTIFSFFGGVASWGWLLLLIDDFLAQVGQKQMFSSWVLKPLGERLHEQLVKEAPTKQGVIYQGVEQVFDDLSKKVIQALSQQIEDTRRAQQQLIQAKEQESFSIEQEKKRLERIGDELLVVLNAASQAISGPQFTPEDLERLAGGDSRPAYSLV
jgi:GTP-binding protein EngB required for normal cell division